MQDAVIIMNLLYYQKKWRLFFNKKNSPSLKKGSENVNIRLLFF